MDLNAFDFDLDLENESDSAESSPRALTSQSASKILSNVAKLRNAASITNSPGCTPANAGAESAPSRTPRPIRSVRTDAWSVPASTSWARPSRTLRKVARRALETEAVEPA